MFSTTTGNGGASKRKKQAGGVRFKEEPAAEMIPNNEKENGPASAAAAVAPSRRRAKRPRPDVNPDELDDIDDYLPDENGDNDEIPGENRTLHAKQQRRLRQQRAGDNAEDEEYNTTHIDNETSLASEGIAIEPFHMQEENTDGTGYFDGDTYIFRRGNAARGVNEEPDAWLEGLQDTAATGNEEGDGFHFTKKSGGDAKDDGNDDEDDDDDDHSSVKDIMDTWNKPQLYAKLLPLVSDTETVSQAIVRYGNLIKQQPKGSSAHDMAKQALNGLTEAASALLLQGDVSIYQQTRQDLQKIMAPATAAAPKPPQDNNSFSPPTTSLVQWEYQGNNDGRIHGPYTTEQMQGWIQQGYFVGPTAVYIRTVADAPTPHSTMQDDLLSDLLEDDNDDDNKDQKPKPKVRGQWVMSNLVDFSKYS